MSILANVANISWENVDSGGGGQQLYREAWCAKVHDAFNILCV